MTANYQNERARRSVELRDASRRRCACRWRDRRGYAGGAARARGRHRAAGDADDHGRGRDCGVRAEGQDRSGADRGAPRYPGGLGDPGWASGAGDPAADAPTEPPRCRCVPSCDLFSSIEMLGRMAMGRMLSGLSTRRYRDDLEPVGQRAERAATSTSKSAISRRLVAATETARAELLAAPLPDPLASTVTKRMRRGLSRRARVSRRSATRSPRERARTHPSRCGRVPARRPGRDADRAAPRRATHPGPHAALHEQHRVDDLHRPHPLTQRQELAERPDGAALVRRRDGQAGKQFRRRPRSPAPARSTRHAR